ncbi:cytochrome c oxidase assembly protein [Nonomuraea wenchangensis]|uniref:cytochrome c oxidase assembly protein n=2 Tax=Nonomuraea wenchangensis TaxID=568860 RepID=UPI00332E2E2B
MRLTALHQMALHPMALHPMALHHHAGGPDLAEVAPVVCWLVLAAAGYLLGLRRLGGPGRSLRAGARRLGRVRVWAFAGGLGSVAAALLPPLDAVADERFSTHMLQHMILISAAGPLLAAGSPGLPLTLALPRRARRVLALARHVLRRVPRRPVAAWAAHVGVLWFWHLPGPYELALRDPVAHLVEHACFLGTSYLLWTHVLSSSRSRLNPPVAILYLFATALPSAALGAVLTLAGAPLFPGQAAAALASGADPLTDQQLAGLIMWIPADLVYLGAIFAVFLAWMDGPREMSAPRPSVASSASGGER